MIFASYSPTNLSETLHHSHLLAVGDVHRVNSVVGGLGETEQIDGIVDIRLALSVQSDKAVQFIREVQLRLADILIIEDM